MMGPALITQREIIDLNHLVQYFFSTDTKNEDEEFPWSKIKNTIQISSIFEFDLSSTSPHFEIKTETYSIESLENENKQQIIPDEEIWMEMLKHDFITKMPPRRKYTIHISIKSRKKGKPKPIEFDI